MRSIPLRNAVKPVWPTQLTPLHMASQILCVKRLKRLFDVKNLLLLVAGLLDFEESLEVALKKEKRKMNSHETQLVGAWVNAKTIRKER